jgi:hypothetical protein
MARTIAISIGSTVSPVRAIEVGSSVSGLNNSSPSGTS